MARKSEIGIEYFPMNTDIIHHTKIRLIIAECGPTSWGVLLPLLCKIYREKGYWIDWNDEDLRILFSQDEVKTDILMVEKLVECCLKREFFDPQLFDKYGILTSDRIQENYLIAKSRSKVVPFIKQFELARNDGQNVTKTFNNVTLIDLNVTLLSKKVYIGTQIEKEKENKRENDSAHKNAHAYTDVELKYWGKFKEFLQSDAPRVLKMSQPFTIDEALKLQKDFRPDFIKNLLKVMHNHKQLLVKNVSANLTFRNWAKRQHDFESGEIKTGATESKLSAAVSQIETSQNN